MTDERYVFNQDVAERSKMKTGAFHKKNGSKSKKCTLPSDHLTESQKKKLSGPCFSINMNEPFHDWKKFRSLPKSMQASYIMGLINNYGARKRDIATMLGTTPGNFSQYCCSALRDKVPVTDKNAYSERVIDERFVKFLGEKEEPKEVSESTPKKTDEEILKERFGIEPKKDPPKPEISNVFLVPESHDTVDYYKTSTPAEPTIENAPIKEVIKEKEEAKDSEYAKVFDTEKVKEPAFMFSALMDAQMSLNGSRDEILNALSVLLGDGVIYNMTFQLSKSGLTFARPQ